MLQRALAPSPGVVGRTMETPSVGQAHSAKMEGLTEEKLGDMQRRVPVAALQVNASSTRRRPAPLAMKQLGSKAKTKSQREKDETSYKSDKGRDKDRKKGKSQAASDGEEKAVGKKKKTKQTSDGQDYQWQNLVFGGSIVLPILFLLFGNPIGRVPGNHNMALGKETEEAESYWGEGILGNAQ